nr:hypothetical protein [Chlamydiota bacterium]
MPQIANFTSFPVSNTAYVPLPIPPPSTVFTDPSSESSDRRTDHSSPIDFDFIARDLQSREEVPKHPVYVFGELLYDLGSFIHSKLALPIIGASAEELKISEEKSDLVAITDKQIQAYVRWDGIDIEDADYNEAIRLEEQRYPDWEALTKVRELFLGAAKNYREQAERAK